VRVTLAVRAAGAVQLAAIASCARIAPPPGGPVDKLPPKLISTRPESTAVLPDFKGEVEFRFDKVVSEGSAPSQGLGTSDLERLVILSPTNAVPRVSWRRDRITVRPAEGWKHGRVYRVELRPGVLDLRRNRTDTNVVLTFTTGAPLPSTILTGQVIDWVGQRTGIAALIEATLSADSLVYRTVADSIGRFALGPLPRGSYVVAAVQDQNRNLRRDGREAYDETRIGPDTSSVPTLWMYPHDTAGPKIQSVTLEDSLALTVQFNRPLDPYTRIEPATVVVRLLPDSIPIHVASALPKWLDDSLKAARRARQDSLRQDSLRRVADTVKAAPGKPPVRKPEVPKAPALAPLGARAGARDTTGFRKLLAERPPLSDRIVIRVDSALVPGAKYVVDMNGVRGVGGGVADARGGITVPLPPKPAATDTLKSRAQPNPGAAPADTTTRKPTPGPS
jgi:hypothetical protein